MGQITIIKRDGTQINLFRTEPFCTVSQAVQNFTLMGDDNVQLTIQSAEIMDFSIGDKILVGGDEYSIRTNANREIIGENRFTYEVTFYGVMYDLMKTMYRDTDINGKSSKSTFDLTYSLSDLVKVIIYNLNRDYPGIWSFDAANCPVTEPKTFSFSKQNCLQVLQNICNEYGYEFRIDLVSGVRTIRIGKFGSVVTPPAGNAFFEWGKGSGLYKLKEQKVDDKSIITRLWVEGGTENIKSGYRNYSDRLQLPMRRLNNHAHTLSNGTVIPAQSEYIGITDDEKRYIEDENLKNKLGSIEDVEQYDIHPARVGKVTALGNTIYSFVDNTMDFDLNERDTNGTKWLIAETSAKITFITGKLAGQQFEMKEYNHSSKTFTIIQNTDERGLSVPTSDSEAFRFVAGDNGDKYKITDINLPDAYVNDAEENLWYAGYDDFHLNRKLVRAQYVLTFDRSYFINALPADSETSVFRVGDYVPVKDVRFNLEKNIRIQKLSRNLLLEHDYTLTISDITTVPIATQIVQEVLDHEIIIEANRLRDTAKARRAWRTTEELRNMVYDTDGYFDPENIKPNSIDTNMLTVGSKSQQFILMDIVLEANVNGLPNRFDVSAGALIHLTIDDSGAKIWNMAATSVTLAESGGYYVFAKCSKSGNQGVFYITQQQLKVEPADDPNNYYFQVGIIGSLHVDDNYRDFTTTYGFTRINGNIITTGKIVTSDGECYLDLDGNKFRIGDANGSIDWNVTGTKQLTLQNVKVLSKSGDLSDIGVFRGNYSPGKTYYPGDEVTFTSNGYLSSYRQIHATDSCIGIDPTNASYWLVKARGGESVYFLNLTNDNSSIAAGSDGTVPAANFNLPSAKTGIQLYLGSAEYNTGVTYRKGTISGGTFSDITDKTIKILSFSEDVASCVIEAVVNNVVFASAIFTVTRVKAGANGEPAILWEIVPSVNVIKKYKPGSDPLLSATSIAFNVYKIAGGVRTLISNVSEGVKMKILRNGTEVKIIDGYAGNESTFPASISVTETTNEIQAVLYSNAGTWLVSDIKDRETIPVLIDGNDGESLYNLDLTNENISLPANPTGEVLDFSTAFTNFNLYKGSSIVAAVYSIVASTGVTAALDSANKKITVSDLTTDTGTVTLYAKNNDGTITYGTAVFSLAKVKNGESSVIYSLLPSVSTIKKDKDGAITPSSITCAKLKRVGSSDPATTTEMSLFYITSANSTETTYPGAITIGSTWTWIEFILKNDTTVLDRERIPIVKDGIDGATGPSPYQLILSNQMASIVLKADGSLDYADAVTTPTLYNGLNTVPNVTYAITSQTGVVASITNGVVSVTSVTNESTNVEITATLQGGSVPIAKVLFKVVKVKSAIAYQIIPSVNAIKKLKDGTFSVDLVNFNVYKSVGGVRTLLTNISGGAKMKILRNGVTVKIYDGYSGNPSAYPAEITVTDPTTELTAMIYKYSSSSWNDADLLDMVTIPVLIDGEDGVDANMLDWVEDWDSRSTLIDNERVISPKMFSGTKSSIDGSLKGVAFGHEVVTTIENGVSVKKTGIIGLKDGKITFIVDSNTGDVAGDGKFSAGDANGKIVLDPTRKAAVIYDANGHIMGRFGFYEVSNNVWDYTTAILELFSFSNGSESGQVKVSSSGISVIKAGVELFSVSQAASDQGNYSLVSLNIPEGATKVSTGQLYRLAGDGVVRVKLG